MKDNTELQEELSNRLEEIELHFAHWMGKISLLGLVLLPLVPGSLALSSIVSKFPDQLGIQVWLAWCIGIATALGIELLGLIAVRLALKMRRFNRRAHGLAVETAPLGQGYAAAALYVCTVLTLTMLLKIWPHAAIYALLPMSLLGALADWIYALSSDQNEREQTLRRLVIDQRAADDREDQVLLLTDKLSGMVDKGELDAATTERDRLQTEVGRLTQLVDKLTNKLSDRQPVIVQTVDRTEVEQPEGKRLSKAERHDALLWRLREVVSPDDIDTAVLSDEFGTSDRTIKRDLEELVQGNRLSINGVVKVF